MREKAHDDCAFKGDSPPISRAVRGNAPTPLATISGTVPLTTIFTGTCPLRNHRLGWTNPPDKKYLFPTKLIRHSPKEDHLLFWREVGAMPEALQSRNAKQKRDPAVDAQELVEMIDGPKTAGELRQIARETFGKQHGDRVQSELVHNFLKYGLVMRKGANNNVQIYGREAMFK